MQNNSIRNGQSNFDEEIIGEESPQTPIHRMKPSINLDYETKVCDFTDQFNHISLRNAKTGQPSPQNVPEIQEFRTSGGSGESGGSGSTPDNQGPQDEHEESPKTRKKSQVSDNSSEANFIRTHDEGQTDQVSPTEENSHLKSLFQTEVGFDHYQRCVMMEKKQVSKKIEIFEENHSIMGGCCVGLVNRAKKLNNVERPILKRSLTIQQEYAKLDTYLEKLNLSPQPELNPENGLSEKVLNTKHSGVIENVRKKMSPERNSAQILYRQPTVLRLVPQDSSDTQFIKKQTEIFTDTDSEKLLKVFPDRVENQNWMTNPKGQPHRNNSSVTKSMLVQQHFKSNQFDMLKKQKSTQFQAQDTSGQHECHNTSPNIQQDYIDKLLGQYDKNGNYDSSSPMSEEDHSDSSALISRGQNSNIKKSTANFQDENPFLSNFGSDIPQTRFQIDEDILSQQAGNGVGITVIEIEEESKSDTNPFSTASENKQSIPNKVSIQDFHITRKLGQGAFGKVYLANYKFQDNHHEFAIKKLSKDFLIRTQKVQSVSREKDLLVNNRSCAFLPKIYHSFSDSENLYIVMEYIPNGTLAELIQQSNKGTGLTKNLVQFFSAQIVLALEYLQQQNVTHRDLKPGNVMMDENNYIKVIDFGEAKIVDNYDTKSSIQSEVNNRRLSVITSSDGQSSFFGRIGTIGNKNKYKRQRTFVGTPMYCAPEMLEHNQAGLFTDLWALGCIMYELSTGKQMFRGRNNQQVYTKILEYEVDFPKNMDRDLIDLIQKLTEYDPSKRIGLKNIPMIKNHPYFQGVDFESLQDKLVKCPPLDVPSFTSMKSFTSDKSLQSDTLMINQQTPEQIEHESKILQIQDEYKSQVEKHGLIMKRIGFIIKTYKQYEVYLLSNGMILFYTTNIQSKKYGEESQRHRLQIDETMRVENISKDFKRGKKDTSEDQVRFTLRIGNASTFFQAKKSDQWIEAITNFKFK